MKIINNKTSAIQELERISTRTTQKIITKSIQLLKKFPEVKNHGDLALKNTLKNLMVSILSLCKLVRVI